MDKDHERLGGRSADLINKVREDIPLIVRALGILGKNVRDKYANMKEAWEDTCKDNAAIGLWPLM